MHYEIDDLEWDDGSEDVRLATLHLAKHDTAVNPGSTRTVIEGPAEVRYEWYPDGSITAWVAEPLGLYEMSWSDDSVINSSNGNSASE